MIRESSDSAASDAVAKALIDTERRPCIAFDCLHVFLRSDLSGSPAPVAVGLEPAHPKIRRAEWEESHCSCRRG